MVSNGHNIWQKWTPRISPPRFLSAPPWAVSCVSPLELEGQSGLWHPRASIWSPRACKETSGDLVLGNGRNVIGNQWKSTETWEIHGNHGKSIEIPRPLRLDHTSQIWGESCSKKSLKHLKPILGSGAVPGSISIIDMVLQWGLPRITHTSRW